jgi:hypothetical protein
MTRLPVPEFATATNIPSSGLQHTESQLLSTALLCVVHVETTTLALASTEVWTRSGRAFVEYPVELYESARVLPTVCTVLDPSMTRSVVLPVVDVEITVLPRYRVFPER